MPKLITHKFVSTIPDGDDTGLVRPSNWNDTHDVSGVAESGANSDITSMTGVTGGISTPDYIQYDTTATPTIALGKTRWNVDTGTLAFGIIDGTQEVQVGQQMYAQVHNAESVTITKGQVVYLYQATGNKASVKLAYNTGDATSAKTLGLATQDIVAGGTGFITTQGVLDKLNTGSYNEGDTLYLGATAGSLTATKPSAPNHLVYIGVVERANNGNGQIYVRVQNGYELDEIHDVQISSPTTGQTLVYNQSTQLWNNSNAPTIIGGSINNTPIGATTPSTGAFTTITGQTEVLSGTGQNLLTQSNAFTNAAWSTSSANVATTVATTDPFGGNNAFSITASATGTSGIGQAISGGSNGVYTFSVYAKAGTSTWLRLFVSTSIFAYFNLSTGVVGTVNAGGTATITSIGNGWYRCSITSVSTGSIGIRLADGDNNASATSGTFLYVFGSQAELSSTVGTYTATTTTAVYGTPTLSFSGVSSIGLLSNGALYLQPAGTGAIQAQATTSTTAGGNARGANAVDWQTSRVAASQVSSSAYATIGGGLNNTSSSFASTIAGGGSNGASNFYAFIGGGSGNQASGYSSVAIGGISNTASGYYGFVGNGFTNSTTSNSAVTTQSGTMNGTTAVTLSGSNANIKVGQYITGTSIADQTYVAAISGTSLTLSKNASGSSTSTLSFFTPHGVVVGGGNNQATGSYSFIGGGGDAGTSANRNVASGDWSFVGGGQTNQSTGLYSSVAGGRINTSSGQDSAILGGFTNTASNTGASALGGYNNFANGALSTSVGGRYSTTRNITGNVAFSACNGPVAFLPGISQSTLLILGRQTTDATATALTSDNNTTGSTTNQVILPNNSAYYFRGEIVAGVTGGGNTKGWYIEGVIKRGANAASTAMVGTPTVTSNYADAGASTWAVAVTADTTNGGIKVEVTGQASTTIRWVAQIRTTEMTY